MSKKFFKVMASALATAVILTGCVGGKKEEKKADPNTLSKIFISYFYILIIKFFKGDLIHE